MSFEDPDADEIIGDNIRQVLGRFIGKTLIDITQHDEGEPDAYVMFLFDDGNYIRFPIQDNVGFMHSVDESK